MCAWSLYSPRKTLQPSSLKQATHGTVPLPILLSQLSEHTIGLDLAIREIGPSRAARNHWSRKVRKSIFRFADASETTHKLRAGPAERWTPVLSSTWDQGIINVWINIFILCLDILPSDPVIRLCRPNLPGENTRLESNCHPFSLTQAGQVRLYSFLILVTYSPSPIHLDVFLPCYWFDKGGLFF